MALRFWVGPDGGIKPGPGLAKTPPRFVIARRAQIVAEVTMLNEAHWLGLRTLVVGFNSEARTLARVLARKRHLGYEVLGFVGLLDSSVDGLPVVGTLNELRETVIAQDVSAIFVAGSGAGPDVLKQIDAAVDGLGVRIRTSLGIPHLAASRVVVSDVDGMAMLAVERMLPSELQRRAKRALDVMFSALGLIAGLPVMVAIAVAIKLHDGGPILFTQKRVGEGGELFTMYKFRTMVQDAERLRAQLMGHNEAD